MDTVESFEVETLVRTNAAKSGRYGLFVVKVKDGDTVSIAVPRDLLLRFVASAAAAHTMSGRILGESPMIQPLFQLQGWATLFHPESGDLCLSLDLDNGGRLTFHLPRDTAEKIAQSLLNGLRATAPASPETPRH